MLLGMFVWSMVLVSLVSFDLSAEAAPGSAVSAGVQRAWLGPDYWANPMEYWQLNGPRMECVASKGGNAFLLTKEFVPGDGDFTVKVRLGLLKPGASAGNGWAGFNIGVRGGGDYRASAVKGKGCPIGITAKGVLFIETLNPSDKPVVPSVTDVTLVLSGKVSGGQCVLTLSALDKTGRSLGKIERKDLRASIVNGGGVEFATSPQAPTAGKKRRRGKGKVNGFWFSGWKVSGGKIKSVSEHAFGPILFTMYTLSGSVLKLTAQMAPVEKGVKAVLKTKTGGAWKTVAEAPVDPLARTARFKIKDWKAGKDVPYRVECSCVGSDGEVALFHYDGVFRKAPVGKKDFVIAAFTGNKDGGFPHTPLVAHVAKIDPDLLFFSGDQIYEMVGGYGLVRSPLDKATLCYLRKWYLFGWAFGGLMKDRPTVCLADDHDVFHGNLWGDDGKPANLKPRSAADQQDSGGYKMPPAWVNMVQRTQTSHMPDPYDPTPIKQGIGVYYCELNYAGVSFGIVEDRKFKSAPKALLPKAKIFNGWVQNPDFDPKTDADVPSAELLGKRQLDFLEHWVSDWSDHIIAKILLSATIFANVATLPKSAKTDDVIPKLKQVSVNDYPPDDRPTADFDSNGWPRGKRDKALEIIRKACALHLAGDQHLGTFTRYGIKQWGDAPYALCVPSICNAWPRRWFPSTPGLHRTKGAPKYTGDFEDGFGNKVTVFAVANPVAGSGKAPGFGIVKIDRKTLEATIECWPKIPKPNPAVGENGQYRGWPFKISLLDTYKGDYALPKLIISGASYPVVSVFDASGGLVLRLAVPGSSFVPRTLKPGKYTVTVVDRASHKKKEFKNLDAVKGGGEKKISVKF